MKQRIEKLQEGYTFVGMDVKGYNVYAFYSTTKKMEHMFLLSAFDQDGFLKWRSTVDSDLISFVQEKIRQESQ